MQTNRAGYCAVLILTLGMTANAGLINGSFENPVEPAASETQDPAGAGIGWTFTGSSYIANAGSGAFVASPTPYGDQAAVLQGGSASGVISQTLTGLTVGNGIYFTFNGSFDGTWDDLPLEVTLNGVDIGDFTITTDTWSQFTTALSVVSAPTMTLAFQGGGTTTTSEVALIDNVSANDPAVPEPASFFLVAPLGAAFLYWRRRRLA